MTAQDDQPLGVPIPTSLRAALAQHLASAPEVAMEEVLAAADGPAAPAPAMPGWTLLDTTGGNVMGLFGLPDGRTCVAISMQGPWRAGDFKPAEKLPRNRLDKAVEHVYRHSYDGARRVAVLQDPTSKVWYAEAGRNVKPTEAGRSTPALHQEEYEHYLRVMAQTLVEDRVPGEDPEATVDRVWGALKLVAKWSFQRAWHELGFGIFGK